MKIKITDKGAVASRPGQMYAWPGMAKALNGDIVVAVSERKFHVDPFGREVVIRSRDNGYSWGLPQEVYNSEMDDRDGNMLALRDGRLVLSWFTSNAFEKDWPERAARVTDKMRKELLGTWMLVSNDNGYTWSETPKSIPAGMHVSPTELSDGSLLSIGFGNRFSGDDRSALSILKSHDTGNTWDRISKIDAVFKDENGNLIAHLDESHVLETSPGNLIALFRSVRGADGNGYLYQAFSSDYGNSWTLPHKTSIWGYPPHMLKLSSGAILCMCSHRRRPYGIVGVLSRDNGYSWDTENIFTIYSWDDEPDMGYPVSLEVAKDEILTVFYCKRDGIKDKNEEPEGLLYVRFKIEG